MRFNLRILRIIVIMLIIIPAFLAIPFSVAGKFGDQSGVVFTVCIFLLSILGPIMYLSQSKESLKNKYKTIFSLLFYLNFGLFMIGTLVSFNFIIIAGFLFTDQTPIGLNLEKSDAWGLLMLGVYLLLASAFGMLYLAKAKKHY